MAEAARVRIRYRALRRAFTGPDSLAEPESEKETALNETFADPAAG